MIVVLLINVVCVVMNCVCVFVFIFDGCCVWLCVLNYGVYVVDVVDVICVMLVNCVCCDVGCDVIVVCCIGVFVFTFEYGCD